MPEIRRRIGGSFPALPLLFEAFESAAEQACQFFEARATPVNRPLFPALVRYHARELLEQRGQTVDELDSEDIGNNGLCLIHRARRIRVWKAEDDELPPPGTSRLKSLFLNQQLGLFLPEDNTPSSIQLNLALLWNVDSNFRLKALHLACPRSAFHMWSPAEAWWTVRLTHPGSAASADIPEPLSDLGDLPLRRIEPQADTREAG
jgi:hypothetical protein